MSVILELKWGYGDMGEMFFPLDGGKVAWDTSVKQSWNIAEYISASGERKALVQQELPQWTMTLRFPVLTQSELDLLIGFYARCRGSWHPFYYKDFERFEVIGKALNRNIDGSYQAVIPIGGYEEPAEKIDNVVVFIDGKRTKDFIVRGGKITVNAVGTVIKFDYEYYHKVVFEKEITVKQLLANAYTVELKLEVVR